MATNVILDVDTGTDDAVALMIAALSLDLDLVGATVVNGNTNVDNCVENTLRVFEWIGLTITGIPRRRQSSTSGWTRMRPGSWSIAAARSG